MDIKTYNRIEEVLENYSLVQLMKEKKDSEVFDINSAKELYSKLDKAN